MRKGSAAPDHWWESIGCQAFMDCIARGHHIEAVGWWSKAEPLGLPEDKWRKLVKIKDNQQALNKAPDQLKRQKIPVANRNQPKFAAMLDALGRADQSKNQSDVKPLTLEDYRNQALRVRTKILRSNIRGTTTDRLTKGELKAPDQIQKIIEDAARSSGVSPQLVTAIIKVESNFNPRAVSSEGARGLMQLMPTTAEELGVRNSFDVRENINAGCRYLKDMLDRFGGNLQLAVAAFNAGPGAVEKYGKIPPYKETQNYVKKVLAYC
jgi:soluble lytic murein transglycosylase-like protein